GIRDFHVTGVQTCALPISAPVAGEDDGAAVEALVRVREEQLEALVAPGRDELRPGAVGRFHPEGDPDHAGTEPLRAADAEVEEGEGVRGPGPGAGHGASSQPAFFADWRAAANSSRIGAQPA